jgi:hypothetical protein
MLRCQILGLRYINAMITAKSQEFWAIVTRFYGIESLFFGSLVWRLPKNKVINVRHFYVVL